MLATFLALAITASPRQAQSGAAACAREISIAFSNPNGDFDGMSHSGAYMAVRNRGPRACNIPGLPKIGLADALGHTISAARDAPALMHPGPVIVPVLLAPGGMATSELRWVSGDVYDGHNCATPARVTATFGTRTIAKAWPGGEICGPQGKPLPFTQTPLRLGPVAQP